MNQLNFPRTAFSIIVGGSFLAVLTGCAVSPAVKGLVDQQTKVTNQSLENADAFLQAARAKAAHIDAGLKELDESMQAVQAEEAKYALAFSASQNLQTKSGVDATAAAYMVAEIYLADQAGLSAKVKTQFADSEAVLIELAKEWKASWQDIRRPRRSFRTMRTARPFQPLMPISQRPWRTRFQAQGSV